MENNNQEIIQEQLAIAYRQLPGIIILPGITAILLSVFFWGHLPSNNILLWLSIALLFTGGTGFILLILYRQSGLEKFSNEYWQRWFNFLALLSGLGWSSSVYFLYHPDDLIYQLILLLFLFFAIALVAIRMNTYRPAFVLLAAPILITTIFRLLLDFDFVHALLAITTLFYGITLYAFYQASHRGFISYLRMGLENRRLAEAMQKRTAVAEDENRSKSRFLAAASHDLRQPLVAQELLVSALKGHIGEENYPEIFDNLKCNIESLHALFNELVEVSRLDTGNIEPSIDYTDLQELFDELKQQFEPLANRKQLDLYIQPDPQAVMSDHHLLKRILVNLLSNAIKYTESGQVKLYQEKTDTGFMLIVEDTGIGIDSTDHQQIFHEFYRAAGGSKMGEGFGLGLAIVKRLAKLLDHKLSLQSEPGKGTRISLSMTAVPDYND